MIPKIIHYCWFGGKPIPEKDKKCIESWKRFCPEYKIIEWNESNYDINKNKYMADAYKSKKFGFVPDYARFDIVYNNGGIYLDTDVELIKPLDQLLNNHAYMGFEGDIWVNGGIGFGAEAGNEIINGLRNMYEGKAFIKDNGEYDLTPSPHYITEYLESIGLKRNNAMQQIDTMMIYPSEYFAAKDFYTGIINITENTISIHQYNASWMDLADRKVIEMRQMLAPLFGLKNAWRIAVLIQYTRYKGIKETLRYYAKKCIN